MISRIGRVVTGRPRTTLLLVAVFMVVSVVFGAGRLGGLSTDGFDDPGSQAQRAQQALVAANGIDPSLTATVLVEAGTDVRSGAGAALVAGVAADLRDVPGVAVVTDPQVSTDGRAAYLIAAFQAGTPTADAATAVQDAFAGREEVIVGGAVVADEEIGAVIGEDLLRAELIAFPILFLVSLLVFRGVIAALMPVMVGMVVIFGGFLGLALANEFLSMSVFATNLIIGLGLGLAVDYALLIVSRYREEAARLGHGAAAVTATMGTAGRSVLFSAFTVAAAMAGLMVFPQDFLFSMGLGGVMVALMAAVVTLTLLPAVLLLLGPRINALAPRSWRARSEAGGAPQQGGWYRLSRAVMRRPGRVAAAAAALMILLALPAAGIRFTDIDAGVLPQSTSARQVHDALETRFAQDATDPVEIVVSAPGGPDVPRDLAAYAAGVAAVDGVERVLPAVRVAPGVWSLRAVLADPALSGEAQRAVREIRAVEQPYATLIGGRTANLIDEKSSLAAHLPVAGGIIGFATIAILFLLTGSVVLAIKAVIMNVLTLAATLGILTAGFQEGWLEGLLGFESLGAVSTTQPILIAALAFGLSTDYGVFLLSRIKEARDSGLPDDEAVAVGLERTGRIVTAAAILFVIAIGAFATSRIVIMKELGVGTALAVLLDATIIRALLVPSLMKLLGRWNWWAPRPLARFHRRFGLREEAGTV